MFPNEYRSSFFIANAYKILVPCSKNSLCFINYIKLDILLTLNVHGHKSKLQRNIILKIAFYWAKWGFKQACKDYSIEIFNTEERKIPEWIKNKLQNVQKNRAQ